MRKIAIWYCDLSSQKQLLLNSSITAILFFFSAIVTNLIADGLGELKRGTIILLYSLAFIMIFVIIITVANVLKSHIEKIKRTAREEKETIAQAYILCDRVISASMKMIDDNLHLNGDYSGAIEGYPLKNIQEIVDATYSTFESAYGVSVNIEKRIDFEVTFMTKSYVDNKITIPASKNRDGRSPQSMVLRKNKPDIYDKTVTASVYKEERPDIQIIEDTTDPSCRYAELYPKQQQRIKSSIIYPVKSDKNELLGTLVVHCDKPGFFNLSRKKYWCDLFDIFAKRIAIEKIKMDKLNVLVSEGIKEISLDVKKCF